MRDRVVAFVRLAFLAAWLVGSNVGAAFLIRWALESTLSRPIGVWPIIACIFLLPLLLVRRSRA